MTQMSVLYSYEMIERSEKTNSRTIGLEENMFVVSVYNCLDDSHARFLLIRKEQQE